MENQDTVFIDFRAIVKNLVSKWYYFVGSLVTAFLIAFLYNKAATPIYKFKSSILIGQNQNGPRSASEMLTAIGSNQQNTTNLKDEKGKLTSFSMVRKVFEDLDLRVSYYLSSDLGKKERYGISEFPFKVVIDSLDPQPLGIPIYIKVFSDSTYELEIDANNVPIYDYSKNEVIDVLPALKISERLKPEEKFSHENISLTIVPDDYFLDVFENPVHIIFNNHDNLADNYIKRLQVGERDRDSYILDLEIEGANAKKEIAILNKLMQVFKNTDLVEKMDKGEKTLEYINNKLYDARTKLKLSESRLSGFKESADIVNTETATSALSSEISRLQQQSNDITLTLKLYERLKGFLDSDIELTESIAASAYNIGDEVVNVQLGEIIKLNKRKIQSTASLGPQHPSVKRLELQINQTKEILKQQVRSAIQSTIIKKQDIDSQYADTQSKFNKIPIQQRRIQELQRSSDFDNNSLQNLRQKKTEAEILLATTASDITILDSARMIGTKPVSPKPLSSYLIAMILGLVIPYLFITVNQYLDDSVKTKEDLITATEIPYLGMVLRGDKSNNLVFEGKSKSGAAESFRSLRVNLQHMRPITNGLNGNGVHRPQRLQTIGLTSSVSGEGKTFCSVNLASAFAQSGKKTIIICGDLRKPKFSEYFDIDIKKGLSGYLVGDFKADDIIQSTQINNLYVIDAGYSPNNPNPTIILDSERMDELMEKLKEEFEQILIDTPPIGFVAEYFILKKYIDSSIYVVRSNYTNKRILSEINELYNSKKVDNINILLNDVKISQTAYAYEEKVNDY